MIEAYAFLAMFSVQILTISVLYPTWFIRRFRTYMTGEWFAQLHPNVDAGQSHERFLTQYRALNIGIAVLGLLFLGYLFSYTQRPNWNDGPMDDLVRLYSVLQVLPVVCIAWFNISFNKTHKRSLPEKRKASLQRRGLFDFVSPFVVSLAALSYFLSVACVLYIAQHPFPSFGGAHLNIGIATSSYALMAFVAYSMLYGKKTNPFGTHTDRMQAIGLTVKSVVYTVIVANVFMSLNLMIQQLDLKTWQPFAQSVFFVVIALLCLMSLIAPPRKPKADVLGSSHATDH